MHNNKKSKNNSKEKLRMILDNVSIKDLSSKDKEYLISLARRIEEQQKMEYNTYKKIADSSTKEEIDPMKPKITIHQRRKVEQIQPPVQKTIEPVIQTQEKPKDFEEIFEKKPETPEIKKEEITEPIFIEVKPKENNIEVKPKENKKQKEEQTITDAQDSQNINDDGLVEWEPIDVQEEIIEEEPIQPKIEEKKPEAPEIKKSEISKPVKEKTLEKKDTIFCSECGTKTEGDDFCFCPNCGSKLLTEEKEEKVETTPITISEEDTKEESKKIEEIKRSSDEQESLEKKVESKEKEIPSFIPVKKMEEEQTEQPVEEANEQEQQLDEWKEIETDIPEKQEQSTEIKEEIIEQPTDKSKQKKEELSREPVEEEKTEPVDEKEEELPWESIGEDIIQPTDKVIDQKEEEVDFSFEKQEEIKVFKPIKCIDDKTAIMLYNYGFTSIDSLKYLLLRDLKKFNGINSKLAKQIKKEIKEYDKEKFSDKNGFSEYIIKDDFEKNKENIVEEKPIEKDEELLKDTKEYSEDTNVFKDISCINDKTSKLLIEDGITSIEILKDIPISDLTNIRGIRRKLAKHIKKEVSLISIPEKQETPEDIKPKDDGEEDLGEWEYFDDEPSQSKDKKLDYYMHKEFTLYEKKITMTGNKKRTVRFFSKAEPDEGKPIKLPKGYEVKENKKTGVPYLRKKK